MKRIKSQDVIRNPFLACALKELKEELNIDVDSLEFSGIAMSKQKMQPEFLYNCQLDQTWEDLYPQMIQAKDYTFEIQELYAVPPDLIVRFTSHSNMTDVAAYSCGSMLKQMDILTTDICPCFFLLFDVNIWSIFVSFLYKFNKNRPPLGK